ncbi:MAG: ACP S-malonyltransferase [Thermotogaceae bacterium]|nr:ACP S-malonyltransferase [Thermotogaceae bacterium]
MIAFLFPGQGSQYPGMGEDFARYESAERFYQIASEVLGFDLYEIMNGDEETLTLTENAQPAIYLTSFIAYEELKKRGIDPDVMAGHSLGEYTALAAAGVYDFETGLYLVRKRGEYISQALQPGKGTMAAIIGLDLSKIEEIVNFIDGVYIANYNAPVQIVTSGLKDAVYGAMEKCKEAGAKRVVELKVSGPFHTPYLRYAEEKMEEEVRQIKFREPCCPIVMNVTAKPTTDPEEIKRNLIAQITGPVKWMQTMETMKEMKVSEMYEVGPKDVLKGLGKRNKVKVKHFSEEVVVENA